jgi:hypothetical protein
MDCSSPPQDKGLTQVSELKDEGVPEDSLGLLYTLPDLGLTQVSELKDEEVPEDGAGEPIWTTGDLAWHSVSLVVTPLSGLGLTRLSELQDEGVPRNLSQHTDNKSRRS